ncbi:restriction endonuclease [Alphaproteobacteria bacterium]|nr:restriction endonuclease [Alphaproteobacteria bacterium]
MVFGFFKEKKNQSKSLEILTFLYEIHPNYNTTQSYYHGSKFVKDCKYELDKDNLKYYSLFSKDDLDFLVYPLYYNIDSKYKNLLESKIYSCDVEDYYEINKPLNEFFSDLKDIISKQDIKISKLEKKEFYLYKRISKHQFDLRTKDLMENTLDVKNYTHKDLLALPLFIKDVADLPNSRDFRNYLSYKVHNNHSVRTYIEGGPIWIEKQIEDYLEGCRLNDLNYSNYSNNYDKIKQQFDIHKNRDLIKFYELFESYNSGSSNGIIEYIKLINYISPYPKNISPSNFRYEYDQVNKILIVNLNLPDFERVEVTKEGKRDQLKLNKTELKNLIEFCHYLIPIRTMLEIFKFDNSNHINSIALNGEVESFNRANGNLETRVILSLFVKKDDMNSINLSNIDPKECFKSLKGVAASKIHEKIPIKPILTFKKDNRIIESKEILDNLQEENLAIMEWDEFEHLIRELFAKEFSQEGAEVKVTQASRDRGVDAIAYDPDPIRGGKFIIQAKRYTATVDVSAVRDLYGTIMNEGANRGILVTTAKFGSDAYDFAKDKNITLLEGNQLLGLLNKHGYSFKIDITEARKILNLTPRKTY